MKAVILARVSTKEQEDGHSLDAQISNLRRYAESKNLDIIEEFKVIESSTKGGRPEFMRMIDFISNQKERTAVIADTVDRLQRSFREMPILLGLLDDDRAEFHFVKEGNVVSKDATSNQKILWNIGIVMAQSYTDQLSDNVKRSIRHKIAKGEWSGPAPLGYLNGVDGNTAQKTIIPDPERAFLIKRFFKEYATGVHSLNEMSRKLKDWGLRSRKGNTVTASTIHELVQNPFYYGMMRVKGALHPHRYEPLITKELFDACEAVRTGRARTQAVTETKYPFIFRGLITCAASGRVVNCDRKKNKHNYLICRKSENTDQKQWVNEELVLDQVQSVFDSIQIPENLLAEILDGLKMTHEAEKEYHQASVKGLRNESDKITKQMDDVLDLLIQKSITQDVYDRKYNQLLNRRREINEALEQHHEGDEQFRMSVSTLVSLASKAAEIFKRSQTDEKRQLIGYVFANLQLDGEKLHYTLNTPFNLLVDLGSYKEWLPGPDSNQRPSD